MRFAREERSGRRSVYPVGGRRCRSIPLCASSGKRLGGWAHFLVPILLSLPAFALNPDRLISQYAHTAWRIQDGFFSGSPNAIAQTTDGYIWIGTQAGLIRFDGARFVPFRPPADEHLHASTITTLRGGSDGSLWIGTNAGLAHWKDGHLTDFKTGKGYINTIREDRQGAIWMVRSRPRDPPGPLCKVLGNEVHCYGVDEGVPLNGAMALLDDTSGGWWVADSTQLAHWNAGVSINYAPPGLRSSAGLQGYTVLAAGRDGSLWAGISRPGQGLGLQHLEQGEWKPFRAEGADSSQLAVTGLLLDRDNALWIGTANQGVYRINGGKMDHFSAADGLSGDHVTDLVEDQEGDVWVATSKGLDKFRDVRVASLSTKEGLSADTAASVLATRDGTIWTGNLGALDSIRGGRVSSIGRANGLPGDQVTSLFEDRKGRLWVGVDDKLFTFSGRRFAQITKPDGAPSGIVEKVAEDPDGSVWIVPTGQPGPRTLLHISDLKVTEEIPIPPQRRVSAIAPNLEGGIWVGFRDGDLGRYDKGQWQIVPLHRPDSTSVRGLAIAPDNAVFGATASGVIEWLDGKLRTLTSNNGLPCNTIYSLIFDDKKTLWLYAECGLLSVAESELHRWRSNPGIRVNVQIQDVLDGAQPAVANFQPAVSMSPDGKLWFANAFVVQEIDPLHPSRNPVPPPVHIEEVIADRKEYVAPDNLRLPPLTREVQIDYTALSFVIPQRVKFRYKLDGWEKEWQDPDTRRQAFYTNLRPRTYRFHVIACNDDGVWNETGASFAFTIAPAYYQTTWFEALCGVAFAGMLWFFYIVRLRHETQQIQQRLGARMEERERIARELHDTLLQGFQGLMLLFQAVMKTLSEHEQAHRMMEQALDRADGVLLEGRERVRDLREEGLTGSELSQTLTRCGEDLAKDHSSVFSLAVLGTPEALDPTVFNEAYQIAREALANAFRHSKASKIEVELTYESSRVFLRIRDDGTGIDQAILREGRAGHWGLSGMRERAQKIGAQLNLWSRPGAGTEVELSVPAAVAYPHCSNESLWTRLKRAVRSGKAS